MRPVKKWNINENGVVAIYNPYKKAKAVLKYNFGDEPYFYCNYCDRKLPGITIDVEHILPKGLQHYAHLEFSWDNFLLSCKSCNGVKLDTDFNLNDVVLPHINNTMLCFNFENDGTVSVKTGLHRTDQIKSTNTISLVGLDIGKDHPDRKPQDDRFAERLEVLNLAKLKLTQFERNKQEISDIVGLAKLTGFWSVWMNVFENHINLKNELIKAFNGTQPDCLTTDINRQ
jgi:uncharacterized protein (TIGR02646 family)